MDRSRVVRWLRIAVSAVCGVICLLLIALWVRSNWRLDSFRYNAGARVFAIDSINSRIFVSWSATGGADLYPFLKTTGKLSDTQNDLLTRIVTSQNRWGFGRYVDLALINTSTVIFPHWFPTAVLAILASAIWINRQFSLRTLLIAMTLAAIMLGLVVALRH
jgi:hypothetical protein